MIVLLLFPTAEEEYSTGTEQMRVKDGAQYRSAVSRIRLPGTCQEKEREREKPRNLPSQHEACLKTMSIFMTRYIFNTSFPKTYQTFDIIKGFMFKTSSDYK